MSPIQVYDEILKNPDYRSECNSEQRKFPEAYFNSKENVRAIIIGADPSNPSNRTFEYVFGLESGADSPYFRPILKNLSFIGLGLKEIYVQNLCRNYFTNVTDKNPVYSSVAKKYWLPELKKEIATFDPRIPVFVTAWKPLEVISPQAAKFYNTKKKIYDEAVIFNEDNELQRPVAALFRGGKGFYSLEKERWSSYSSKLKELLFK